MPSKTDEEREFASRIRSDIDTKALVILFGSCARNESNERSDIDIAVVSVTLTLREDTAMYRKTITLALALIMLAGLLCLPAGASAGEIKVLVNGKAVVFDQPPIIDGGRTLVPLRAIFDALGAKTDWNAATQTVTATRGSITIKLTIGEKILDRDGVKVTLDVPAKIIGGRTLVPVRAIGESFGSKV